jgi:hypothetical protein
MRIVLEKAMGTVIAVMALELVCRTALHVSVAAAIFGHIIR